MRQYWPCQIKQQLLDALGILSKEEKSVVKKTIETICTPTKTMHCLKGAFTSTKERELIEVKTHSWHIMFQVHVTINI